MAPYYVMGRNSVREILDTCPERIQKIFVKRDDANAVLQSIAETAEHKGVELQEHSKEQLEALVNSGSHQSVVALMTQSPVHDFKSFLPRLQDDTGLVLALDGIEDPHNLGAIIRSAECFQVSAVLWSSNRGAAVTPTVTKVSSGASELVPLVQCKNLRSAISTLKKQNYWIVATHISDSATSIHNFEFPEKTVLVIGSEQKGVSRLLVDESDFQVLIPMLGRVDSLNVSQSAACLLSEWRRQRGV